MDTEGDDDGYHKLSCIHGHEGQLSCEGRSNLQSGADHEAKGAANVWDSKAAHGSEASTAVMPALFLGER